MTPSGTSLPLYNKSFLAAANNETALVAESGYEDLIDIQKQVLGRRLAEDAVGGCSGKRRASFSGK